MATVIDTLGGQRPRHPEKQSRPDTPILRKPEWLRVRAPGSPGYNAWRGQVGHAWMTANPDLRLAGPSLGWTKAFETASRVLESGARQVRAPVLMLNPDRRADAFCRQLADCTATTLGGARSALHIEADRWRSPWLDAVVAFIDARAPTVTTATISAVPARP